MDINHWGARLVMEGPVGGAIELRVRRVDLMTPLPAIIKSYSNVQHRVSGGYFYTHIAPHILIILENWISII